MKHSNPTTFEFFLEENTRLHFNHKESSYIQFGNYNLYQTINRVQFEQTTEIN